jgi:HAMP domain-containing protein
VVASTLAPGQRPLDPSEVGRAAHGTILVGDRAVPSVEGEARIIASPADSAAGSFIVVAGASTQDRSETLSGLAGSFLIGAPIALLLACGLGYLLAGRALVPVDAMRRRAREITLERSGERLPLPRADDEIHQLGQTLNEMLDRI